MCKHFRVDQSLEPEWVWESYYGHTGPTGAFVWSCSRYTTSGKCDVFCLACKSFKCWYKLDGLFWLSGASCQTVKNLVPSLPVEVMTTVLNIYPNGRGSEMRRSSWSWDTWKNSFNVFTIHYLFKISYYYGQPTVTKKISDWCGWSLWKLRHRFIFNPDCVQVVLLKLFIYW